MALCVGYHVRPDGRVLFKRVANELGDGFLELGEACFWHLYVATAVEVFVA